MIKKIITTLLIVFFFSTLAFAQTKKADLAGTWYPSDAKELSAMLDGYLGAAILPAVNGRTVAIISPHAGLVYSGPVAAYGYKLLSRQNVSTVIILGFSHRKYYDGVSVYAKGRFQTPLGNLETDERVASLIIKASPRFNFYRPLFDDENSIEMELFFIKKVLPQAKIVAVAFGTSDYEDARVLAETLSRILKERSDVVLIASTDMSHYKSYEETKSIDQQTIDLMKDFNYSAIYKKGISYEQPCCGYMPVACMLMAAKNIGADNFQVLRYANSGDTTGDKRRVVGYLSAAIYKLQVISHKSQVKETEGQSMLNPVQRKRLLQIARESITSFVRVGKKKEFKEDDPLLNEPLGVFVTLRKNGQLRGCIGNMVGSGPLYRTVAAMAIEAATGDPRFPTLSVDEIDKVDIEISVLSKMSRVKDASQIDIPGNGVLVRRGFRSGVYLPQVADETGWNKEEFLTSLCVHKAGLAPDAWKDPDTELYVFTAEVFAEKE